jgi:RND family efflux transporter MFP subunit
VNGDAIATPRTRIARMLLVAIGVLAAIYVAALVPRIIVQRRLANEAQARRDRAPLVSTTTPQRAPAVADVELPGTIQAILETGIFARTDGYLRARYVDIGDKVTTGQLLAEIDAPEIDQQLNQARASLAEAKANVVKLQADLNLAKSTLQRYIAAGVGSVSKQQVDERTSSVETADKTVEAAKATAAANQANVDRLEDLQGFERVYAPFPGIITARNVDPGALISAGTGQGVRELFRLAQVDTLRIFVFVPQTWAPFVSVGETADVSVRERLGLIVKGTVTRTAGSVDPNSRTMLAQVEVDNKDGQLLSGSYGTVKFHITRDNPPLLIPANALLVDASGIRVAVVQGDASHLTLHYQPVQIGRDYGDQVEVVGGLDEHVTLATGLTGNLVEGTGVRVAKPDEKKPDDKKAGG